MNNIRTFANDKFGTIRTIERDGEPWFVGKDVAEILGYSDLNKAIAMHVDLEDKKLNDKTSSSFGQRGATLINESGLYSLILSSKLPTAKAFKRWVTAEVLPAIRKTGGYVNDDDLFISKYLPFADDSVKAMFKSTLEIVKNQNELIEQQKKVIKEKDDTIDYKEDVIIGLVKDITLADKRHIVNRIVRKNTNGNYRERYNVLYREFQDKYKVDLDRRMKHYNEGSKPKCKSKMEYIDKILNMIPELYEIAAKIYENDVKELVAEMYEVNGR